MRSLRFLPAIVLLAFSQAVSAAQIPPVICDGLPGCNTYSSPLSLLTGLPVLTDLFVGFAAAGAVLAMLWAALLMLYGGEQKMEQAKKSIIYGLGGLALALSSTTFVTFIVSMNWGQASGVGTSLDVLFFSGGGILATLLNLGLAAFNGGIVIIVMYAGYLLLMSRGKDEGKTKALNIFKWAFVGAVVANLSRALVQIFVNVYTSLFH